MVEIVMLVLSIIATVATVISTIIAVRSKNESKKILTEIKSINVGKRNASNTGVIKVSNTGENSGIMSGINTGEVHNAD